MMVYGVILIPGAEVEDTTVASVETASAAEDFTARKGAHKDQLIRRRDVEELPVHLLLRDDDW